MPHKKQTPYNREQAAAQLPPYTRRQPDQIDLPPLSAACFIGKGYDLDRAALDDFLNSYPYVVFSATSGDTQDDHRLAIIINAIKHLTQEVPLAHFNLRPPHYAIALLSEDAMDKLIKESWVYANRAKLMVSFHQKMLDSLPFRMFEIITDADASDKSIEAYCRYLHRDMKGVSSIKPFLVERVRGKQDMKTRGLFVLVTYDGISDDTTPLPLSPSDYVLEKGTKYPATVKWDLDCILCHGSCHTKNYCHFQGFPYKFRFWLSQQRGTGGQSAPTTMTSEQSAQT